MMKEFTGEVYNGPVDNMYEQLAMDVSTLEYGRSIDAMDDGYEQMEMSVMNGNLNTPEMIKVQAGVTGDTIYMGSISVYPTEEQNSGNNYGNTNSNPYLNMQAQPYYDPTTGMMYMPMYPVYGMGGQPVQPQVQSTQMTQPQVERVQPIQPKVQKVQPVQPQVQTNYKPVVTQPPVQPTPVNTVQIAPVTQETTMYPATSVTKMVDIFGEDKKYSKALMDLQAENEYKVALNANAGKNGKRYMYNLSHMDKTRQLLNWNWGAFLFGPLWYAYRKMPVRAFLLLLGVLYGLSTPYGLAVMVIIPLLVGAFSDKFYKNKLDYMIDKQFMMTKEKRDNHIANRGGVSIVSVVMFILITTVIGIGAYLYLLPEIELLRNTWEDLLRFVQNLLGVHY